MNPPGDDDDRGEKKGGETRKADPGTTKNKGNKTSKNKGSSKTSKNKGSKTRKAPQPANDYIGARVAKVFSGVTCKCCANALAATVKRSLTLLLALWRLI